MCKKQGAVSHSSSEAEVISLDANVRIEGLPAQQLWSALLDVFSEETAEQRPVDTNPFRPYNQAGRPLLGGCHYPEINADSEEIDLTKHPLFVDVDHVPSNVRPLNPNARLFIFEDNEAVIKMCIKGRSLAMRHVPRTHRVDLDGMFDRMLHDTSIRMRFVGTKEQVADIFTKGSFSADTWKELVDLLQIRKSQGGSPGKPSGPKQEDISAADSLPYEYGMVGLGGSPGTLLDPYMFHIAHDDAPCLFAPASFVRSSCEAEADSFGLFAIAVPNTPVLKVPLGEPTVDTIAMPSGATSKYHDGRVQPPEGNPKAQLVTKLAKLRDWHAALQFASGLMFVDKTPQESAKAEAALREATAAYPHLADVPEASRHLALAPTIQLDIIKFEKELEEMEGPPAIMAGASSQPANASAKAFPATPSVAAEATDDTSPAQTLPDAYSPCPSTLPGSPQRAEEAPEGNDAIAVPKQSSPSPPRPKRVGIQELPTAEAPKDSDDGRELAITFTGDITPSGQTAAAMDQEAVRRERQAENESRPLQLVTTRPRSPSPAPPPASADMGGTGEAPSEDVAAPADRPMVQSDNGGEMPMPSVWDTGSMFGPIAFASGSWEGRSWRATGRTSYKFIDGPGGKDNDDWWQALGVQKTTTLPDGTTVILSAGSEDAPPPPGSAADGSGDKDDDQLLAEAVQRSLAVTPASNNSEVETKVISQGPWRGTKGSCMKCQKPSADMTEYMLTPDNPFMQWECEHCHNLNIHEARFQKEKVKSYWPTPEPATENKMEVDDGKESDTTSLAGASATAEANPAATDSMSGPERLESPEEKKFKDAQWKAPKECVFRHILYDPPKHDRGPLFQVQCLLCQSSFDGSTFQGDQCSSCRNHIFKWAVADFEAKDIDKGLLENYHNTYFDPEGYVMWKACTKDKIMEHVRKENPIYDKPKVEEVTEELWKLEQDAINFLQASQQARRMYHVASAEAGFIHPGIKWVPNEIEEIEQALFNHKADLHRLWSSPLPKMADFPKLVEARKKKADSEVIKAAAQGVPKKKPPTLPGSTPPAASKPVKQEIKAEAGSSTAASSAAPSSINVPKAGVLKTKSETPPNHPSDGSQPPSAPLHTGRPAPGSIRGKGSKGYYSPHGQELGIDGMDMTLDRERFMEMQHVMTIVDKQEILDYITDMSEDDATTFADVARLVQMVDKRENEWAAQHPEGARYASDAFILYPIPCKLAYWPFNSLEERLKAFVRENRKLGKDQFAKFQQEYLKHGHRAKNKRNNDIRKAWHDNVDPDYYGGPTKRMNSRWEPCKEPEVFTSGANRFIMDMGDGTKSGNAHPDGWGPYREQCPEGHNTLLAAVVQDFVEDDHLGRKINGINWDQIEAGMHAWDSSEEGSYLQGAADLYPCESWMVAVNGFLRDKVVMSTAMERPRDTRSERAKSETFQHSLQFALGKFSQGTASSRRESVPANAGRQPSGTAANRRASAPAQAKRQSLTVGPPKNRERPAGAAGNVAPLAPTFTTKPLCNFDQECGKCGRTFDAWDQPANICGSCLWKQETSNPDGEAHNIAQGDNKLMRCSFHDAETNEQCGKRFMVSPIWAHTCCGRHARMVFFNNNLPPAEADKVAHGRSYNTGPSMSSGSGSASAAARPRSQSTHNKIPRQTGTGRTITVPLSVAPPPPVRKPPPTPSPTTAPTPTKPRASTPEKPRPPKPTAVPPPPPPARQCSNTGCSNPIATAQTSREPLCDECLDRQERRRIHAQRMHQSQRLDQQWHSRVSNRVHSPGGTPSAVRPPPPARPNPHPGDRRQGDIRVLQVQAAARDAGLGIAQSTVRQGLQSVGNKQPPPKRKADAPAASPPPASKARHNSPGEADRSAGAASRIQPSQAGMQTAWGRGNATADPKPPPPPLLQVERAQTRSPRGGTPPGKAAKLTSVVAKPVLPPLGKAPSRGEELYTTHYQRVTATRGERDAEAVAKYIAAQPKGGYYTAAAADPTIDAPMTPNDDGTAPGDVTDLEASESPEPAEEPAAREDSRSSGNASAGTDRSANSHGTIF